MRRQGETKLTSSYLSWRKYRETCEKLQKLSDRELGELGITRDDIPFIARRAL